MAGRRATDDSEIHESLQGIDPLPADGESLSQPCLYMVCKCMHSFLG